MSACDGRPLEGDPRAFEARFRRKLPLVCRGYARRWPALTRWSFAYFAERAADRTAVTETGRVLHDETRFRQVKLADYIGRLRDGWQPASGEPIEYLSLFDLFAAFPEVAGDVDFSALVDRTLWSTRFGWLGPAGTVTDYHIDWVDNLLVQIVGRKRLWLVGPADTPRMYPSHKFDYRSSISQVDPACPEATPGFAEVRPMECVLEPGDAVYIPRGWWHRVEGIEASINVNAFGHDWAGVLYHQPRASLQRALHRVGLYRRDDCTCHIHRAGRRWPRGVARASARDVP